MTVRKFGLPALLLAFCMGVFIGWFVKPNNPSEQMAASSLTASSSISEDHIDHPGEVLSVSDKVAVRIIRIDSDQHQIGLSMKQVNSSKFVEADMEMMTSLQD